MSNKTNGIGTWSELNSKLGTAGIPSSKCPTEAELTATGKATISPMDRNSSHLPPYDYVKSSGKSFQLMFLYQGTVPASLKSKSFTVKLSVNSGSIEPLTLTGTTGPMWFSNGQGLNTTPVGLVTQFGLGTITANVTLSGYNGNYTVEYNTTLSSYVINLNGL